MNKWQEVRLEDIIDINPSVSLEKGKEYPYIDIERISPALRTVISEETKEYDGQGSKFDAGDTVFSRITPCLENRKIAQALSDGSAFGSTEFYVFRAKESLADPDFIYYLASSDMVVLPAINSMSGASGRQRADKRFIQRLKIKTPNLHDQRRIANILTAYDNLIEVNNKRIKVLEQMAENLYKEWFVRFRFPGHETAEFENGIPKGWKIKKIKEIVKRLPFGELYKTEDTEKEGKVIVIDQSQDEFVGFHNNEPSHIATPEKPIALFGDHSCKYQLMITPFSLSENVVPYIGEAGVLTGYLYYVTHGTVETTEYKRHWTEFVAKKVLMAPFPLQTQFVQHIITYVSLIQKYKEHNRNLIKQRDLLLPRLMSGKLEV